MSDTESDGFFEVNSIFRVFGVGQALLYSSLVSIYDKTASVQQRWSIRGMTGSVAYDRLVDVGIFSNFSAGELKMSDKYNIVKTNFTKYPYNKK